MFLLLYVQHTADIWPIYGQHTPNVLTTLCPTHGRHMANIRPCRILCVSCRCLSQADVEELRLCFELSNIQLYIKYINVEYEFFSYMLITNQ